MIFEQTFRGNDAEIRIRKINNWRFVSTAILKFDQKMQLQYYLIYIETKNYLANDVIKRKNYNSWESGYSTLIIYN